MRYFQNKVAESTWTLPFTVVYAVVVMLSAGVLTHFEWVCLPLLSLSVYMMLEMNNRNALLRVRSRMVSSAFLFLSLMCGSVNTDYSVALIQLSVVFSTFCLTITCQDRTRTGLVFYIAAATSISSLSWMPILWLVCLYLLLLIRPLNAASFRTGSALILGVLLPYWFYVPVTFYQGDYSWWMERLNALCDSSRFLDYSCVTIGNLLVYLVLVILSVVGAIHFLRYSYQDKIRVRLLMWMFLVMSLVMTVLIALIPAYTSYLLPVLCIPTGVLSAHLFIHTSTRLSNVFFSCVLVIVILITIFNQCLTSLSNLVLGASL